MSHHFLFTFFVEENRHCILLNNPLQASVCQHHYRQFAKVWHCRMHHYWQSWAWEVRMQSSVQLHSSKLNCSGWWALEIMRWILLIFLSECWNMVVSHGIWRMGPQRPGCTGGTGGQPKLPKNPPQPRTKAQINYIAKNERRSKEGFTFLASRDAQEVVLVILLADHFHSLLKGPFYLVYRNPMDHETTPRNEGWWKGLKDFLIMHSVSFLFEKTFSLFRSGSIKLWVPWFWDQTLPARSTHQSKAATKNCLPRSIFSLEKNRLGSIFVIFVRPFDNVARHSRVIEDGRQLDWSGLWACWSNKIVTVLESTRVKITN